MFKPEGYDEARASGEFIPVTPGGHYCIIKKVEETQSKTGKDMIVVYFDFAPKDSQPEYFMKQFRDDTRDDKKWPFAGRKYIMVNDYKDKSKTSRKFKTFCSCVENSNNNFVVQWGDDWGGQFVGKQIGAVYGKEEQEYDGNVTMRCLPRYFCKVSAVESAAVPEERLLAPKTESQFVDPLPAENMPF